MTAAVAKRQIGNTGRSRARAPRTTRPRLQVLDQQAIRWRARRRNALLTLFMVVLVGFFGVAFVHAQLVAGQHDLDVIRGRIAESRAERASVERAVEEASSPQAIVARASDIGMVRAYQPVYLAPNGPTPEVPVPVTFAPASTVEPSPALADLEPRPIELIAAPASEHLPATTITPEPELDVAETGPSLAVGQIESGAANEDTDDSTTSGLAAASATTEGSVAGAAVSQTVAQTQTLGGSTVGQTQTLGGSTVGQTQTLGGSTVAQTQTLAAVAATSVGVSAVAGTTITGVEQAGPGLTPSTIAGTSAVSEGIASG